MSTRMCSLAVCAIWAIAGCSSKLDGPNVVKTSTYQPDPGEKIVCKKSVPTGSHITKRTCRTERAWAALTAEAQAMAREMDQRGTRIPVIDRERRSDQF